MRSSILDFAPDGIELRDNQKEILRQVQYHWHQTDVVLLVMPVAYGKSILASTIINWNGSGSLIAPNNVLVNQLSNTSGYRKMPKREQFATGVHYLDARHSLKGSKVTMNYCSYLANRAYNNLLISDESHLLCDFLRDKEAITLWKHLDHYPDGLETSNDLRLWLESIGKTSWNKKQKKLMKFLSSDEKLFTLAEGEGTYRNNPQQFLKLSPTTPRNNKPIMWPPYVVKKIVLMSATLNHLDLYDLGLDKRRFVTLEAPSPIDPRRRPIIYQPVAGLSFRNIDRELPKVADYLKNLMQTKSGKAIWHCTYDLSNKLQHYFRDCPNVMFHNKFDKIKKYDAWRNLPADSNTIFVGCGMTEGIDLKDDLARWQVIVKLPFANLKDPAINARLSTDPKLYAWDTIKQVLQASGRVCRHPNDYGETFIIDACFGVLLNKHKELFPAWFCESLVN